MLTASGTTPLQERFFIGDGQDSTRQLLDAGAGFSVAYNAAYDAVSDLMEPDE